MPVCDVLKLVPSYEILLIQRGWYNVFTVGLGWFERCTWDLMRPRIWCKNVQDVGSTSPDILHYISHLHCGCICSLVVFCRHPDFTTSRSSNIKLSWCLSAVSDSWAICLWIVAKYVEISSDAISCYATSSLLDSPSCSAHRHYLCFG